MQVNRRLALALFAGILGYGASAQAAIDATAQAANMQDATNAIRSGNVANLAAIVDVVARDGDPQQKAQLAALLEGAANATKDNGNNTGASILAALAVKTGGLNSADTATMTALAQSTAAGVAILAAANAGAAMLALTGVPVGQLSVPGPPQPSPTQTGSPH